MGYVSGMTLITAKWTIDDRENNHFQLIYVGWEGNKRVFGPVMHLDIIDGKIWVQRDDTEDGVTYDLEEAGIPKDKIDLDFAKKRVGLEKTIRLLKQQQEKSSHLRNTPF